MKYKVAYAIRHNMPDIYDKEVDRRGIRVAFIDDKAKHLIVINYMIKADEYQIATQLTDGHDDYWGAEVEYHNYKHKPTISMKTWADLDRVAQEYINKYGVGAGYEDYD
jgi:hypothetical protein